MKLFKITDNRGKISYTSSFDFATAITTFSAETDGERKKIVSIKELTDYSGTAAFKKILSSINELEKELSTSNSEVTKLVGQRISPILYPMKTLVERCLGE